MFNPFRRVKILPVLVLVLALSFGLRLNEFASDVTQDHSGRAFAEEISAIAPQAGDEETQEIQEKTADDEPRTVETAHDAEEEQTAGTLGEAPPPISVEKEGENWRDSMDEEIEYSEVRMELFEDLSNRRAELDKREKEMNLREALLKAAEQELEQKYKELLSLREEIQALLVTQSKEEEERIASLVKIYEGMKAKDAARIFNTLDMDVLLSVLSKMSERKSAPIIAAMTPDRARQVTIMLAEQKALPNAEDILSR